MALMKKYLKEFYKKMLLGFTIKSTGTMLELALPYILSHILTNVIGKEVGEVVFWGAAMILLSGTGCLMNITANRMAARVARNFAENVRRDLFKKTLTLSSRQTDKFTLPSLEARITTDTYNVHHFVNMIQRMGVRAPILLVGGVIITLIMDTYLALVMIALLPFIFVTVYFISSKGVPMYTKVQKAVDEMVRVVREDVHGIRVIKALSKAEHEAERYDRVNKKLSQAEVKAGVTMGGVNPAMTFFMNMGSVGVIAIGALRVTGMKSTPETIIAFMQYFTLISMAMMSVTRIFVMYTKSEASAKRIMEVLDEKEELTLSDKREAPDIITDAHIKFDNVSFSYNRKKNDLENISFEVKKGGRVGIIGATGSGKSTIIKLLLRFYDTDKGGVYINGENVKTIDKKALCEKFAVVLQQDFLYADTIEENIKFGRDITHDDVVWAAKIAQADGFINDFNDGYEHMLSARASNISGGQKQRLLIARAIAAKSEILIMDDSSSALDYKTDAALRAAIKGNLEDVTVVTIAQRVSSIKDCDIIIVLDEGKIIAMGEHDYLMENCDEYSEISESQMGGAFVE